MLVSREDREPPWSPEAESAVLGACMVDGLALVRTLDVIGDDAEAFYREAHRRIWRAALELCERGSAVDVVTLEAELKRTGDLAAVGGTAYLVDLASSVPTTANVTYYAGIVADQARRRRLLEAARRCVEAAYGTERSTESIAEELRAASELAAEARGDPVPAGEVLATARVAAEERLRNRDGVELGFAELARYTGPLLPGTLMVVSASETSTGKTTMALQSCGWAAARGRRVLYCSVEMGPEQVGARMADLFAGVNLARPRTLSEADWARVRELEGELPPTLWVDHWSHTSVEVSARAARLAQRLGGIDLVAVDGLHDLEDEPLARNEREETILARSVQRFKRLAVTLRCAVLLTAQPSIQGAKEGRKPRTSDLRGSGRIGQRADIVLFLWRPPNAQSDEHRVVCRWILAKNRLAPTGEWEMDFDLEGGGRWRTPLSRRLQGAISGGG